jgi:hypothetical protein
MLALCRDLIGLRDAVPELRGGDYATIDSTPEGMWAWRRGDRVVVALNLAYEPARLDDVTGLLRICTRRERDGEGVEGALELGPWEGAVVWLDGESRLALP